MAGDNLDDLLSGTAKPGQGIEVPPATVKVLAPEFTDEEVDHPAHYNQHPKIECIDVIEVFPFNIGSAIKYLWRAGLKPGTEEVTDLKKALWYIQREVARKEGRA